jgi:hypothetical protein
MSDHTEEAMSEPMSEARIKALREWNRGGADEVDELIDEVERLRGIKPELPPFPPEGDGLPRYGLRWNGPTEPLAVPMPDGYWTPWHLANAGQDTGLGLSLEERNAELRQERNDLRAQLEHEHKEKRHLKDEVERLREIWARHCEVARKIDARLKRAEELLRIHGRYVLAVEDLMPDVAAYFADDRAALGHDGKGRG